MPHSCIQGIQNTDCSEQVHKCGCYKVNEEAGSLFLLLLLLIQVPHVLGVFFLFCFVCLFW
jgi:hypothetical protein